MPGPLGASELDPATRRSINDALKKMAAGYQPLDPDLTTIAGLTATTDNFIQAKASAWASRTLVQVAADLKVEIGKLMFPVGAIYTATVSTNPGSLLGFGTWVAYGAGRVIVGKAGSGTFVTAGGTGGVETVTLTSAQSGSPAHSHPAGGDSNGTGYPYRNAGSLEWGPALDGGTTSSGWWTQPATANSVAANAASAHTILQPYIIAYVWERTV